MEKSNLNNLMKRIQKDRDEMAFSEIFDFFAERNFVLKRLKTCGGGIGCNEFVFKKLS